MKRVIAAVPLLLLLATIAGSPPAGAEACSNEARRDKQAPAGAALPECRAYELVTPNALVLQDSSPARASDVGGGLAYYDTHPAPGADSSSYFYLARRTPSAWTVESIGPQDEARAFFENECEQNIFFSPDLSKNIDEEGWFTVAEPGLCKEPGAVLVPEQPLLYRNVFVHDNATDAYQLVNATPSAAAPANAKFQDVSDDFSSIIFSEEAQLTSDAPAEAYDFYVWAGDGIRLLTRLPDGSPTAGELADAAGHRINDGNTLVRGSGLAPVTGAVSADGRRAFFYAGNNLYVRENPDQAQSPVSTGECTDPLLACTRQIDVSRGPGPSGNGVFWWASSNGSRVFFSAESKLTNDSEAVLGKAELYEYDLDSKQLTDITPGSGTVADVRGVTAVSDEGSYVYFVANGVLAPGATPGNCETPEVAGQKCNLYVAHNGSVAFIAKLGHEERWIWQEGFSVLSGERHKPGALWADSSPNGRYLLFSSTESLTGYDNHDVKSGQPDREVFLYDAQASAGSGELSCVSCPSDSSPAHDPFMHVVFGGNNGSSPGGNASWAVNSVLDDGTVLFDTSEALLPQDTNESADVYRYRNGEYALISSGSYAGNSHYLDASPDGTDVYFRTSESLLRVDRDHEHASIYDARIEGGFPEPLPPPSPCVGEACRPPVMAPGPVTEPGSATFSPPKRRQNRRCRHRSKRRQAHRCHHRSGAHHTSGAHDRWRAK